MEGKLDCSRHRRRRARALLGGTIDMWLATTGAGIGHAEARDVAAAVGIPYVALALLNSTPAITTADLEEWQRWPEREDFLVALRSREV